MHNAKLVAEGCQGYMGISLDGCVKNSFVCKHEQQGMDQKLPKQKVGGNVVFGQIMALGSQSGEGRMARDLKG